MNIFKTKKFILTTLLIILMTTLSFGVLQVFRDKDVHSKDVYAFTNDGTDVDLSSIATITYDSNSYWKSTGDGVFEANVPYTKKSFFVTWYETKSADLTLKLTVDVQSKLKLKTELTTGSLTSSPSVPIGSETTLVLEPGENTIKFTCSSVNTPANGVAKVTIISLSPNSPGIDGTDIKEGYGTTESPYLINEESDFAAMDKALNAVFSLENDITLTKNFTPIGSSSAFCGTFLGNGHKISNMTIQGGTYRGMFAQTSGGTIKDLTLENVNITNASTYSAMLIGYAVNGTVVQNVNVSGNISAVASSIGGIVGYADGHTAVNVSNCNVYGEIKTTATNIGGLSGAGGKFTDCVVYANIEGVQLVGGLTGGYKSGLGTTDKTSGVDFGSFTNCFVAGDVAIAGVHKNNYPYWGLINGYGAYCKYTLSNVGQRLTLDYTSTKDVAEIKIFNSNLAADGIVVTPTSSGDKYTFTQDINLTQTFAGGALNGLDMLSDTNVVGITGNYGGFTIRFKMADGTYKYVSTLNKEQSRFESNISVKLDDLTSYVDNFANIEIDTAIGTKTFVNNSICVWGAAKVSTANDFEHLSWVINGAIPTTFGSGDNAKYFNARSVITISISMQANIDLTAERKDANGNVLNRDSSGNITSHFYGFGKTEMYPYRGSFYGNGKALTVNMNFPEAYLLGIICVATEQESGIIVENLTVNGTIVGRYRVGIVAMNDNYARSCTLTFNNVVNNANITAKSQVGAFLGEAQGNGVKMLGMGTQENAKIYLNNCVNNGNITATQGDAGGLIGVLDLREDTYAIATLNGCVNNGKVTASGYAGGFIANIANTVTVSGINVSSGIVTSSSGNANFYVANYRAGTYSSTSGLKTLYKINLGVADATWQVTATGATLDATSFTADANGVVSVGLVNAPNYTGVTLSVSVPLLKNAVSVTPSVANTDNKYSDQATLNQYKKTMATFVKVPISINLNANNVYETTASKDSWNLNAIVGFNDATTENISLSTNIDSNKLATNQMVFNNVTFDHSVYAIPQTSEFVKNLLRITADVEDYVQAAASLVNKTSGTNEEFTTIGTSSKTKYDALLSELSVVGLESDLERFNSYISNQITNISNKNVNAETMAPYYKNIIVSGGIDSSALENINLNYGVYSTTKAVKFTMLNGEVISKDVAYTFEKSDITNDLKVTNLTTEIIFKVGDVVTCSFTKNNEIEINKIDILGIEFDNAEYVFDNTVKTITVELTLLEGDSLDFSLTYNGQQTATEVGEYEVVLASISGNDSRFYNIPANYTKGKLTISPLNYVVDVEHEKKFTYNQQLQATDFNLTQSSSEYQLTEEDYVVKYSGTTVSGEEYEESETMPTEAGSYTATIVLTNKNLAFSSASSFSFEIQPQKISKVNCETVFNYNATAPTFEFTFEELLDGDNLTVEYKIFDINGAESTAINAGYYKLQITSVGNANYYVEDLFKELVVNQANLKLTLPNLTSIYGDEFALNQDDYILEGTVYSNDDLGIKLSTQATVLGTAGNHPIVATTNNSNYNFEIINGNYEITKRDMLIDYRTLEYTYNSQDFYSEIEPELTNIVEKDRTAFVFELYKNGVLTTEFKNAGNYTLKLAENSILNNYSINQTEEDYVINQVNITLKPTKVEKIYNQALSIEDFGLESVTLAGHDKLSDVASIEYEVLENGNLLSNISKLDAGTYVISLKLTPGVLYENYNITLENNDLVIKVRETYLVAQNIEKFYNEQEVDFSANLFGMDNEHITEAEITYTYTLNGNPVEEMVNVGNYVITVNATAGNNNKPATATYNVVIKTNIITIALNNAEVVYNAQNYVPNFTYAMSRETDISSILSYEILDKNKEQTTAVNVGEYYISFKISNKNYALTKSTFAVQIKPIEISIKIQDWNVVYGENISIENTTYKVVSGAILEGEDLNLTYFVIDFNGNVGKYIVSANVGNNNYQVTVESAILNIQQREVLIDYGKLVYDYNSQDYYSELKPKLTNVVEQDKKAFVFELYKDNDLTAEFRNAGNYTLKLLENDVLNNYLIKKKEENYIINQKDITLKPIKIEKNYNQELSFEDLKLMSVTLAGHDTLESIANIEFVIFEDTTLLNDISKLDVGTYIITLKLTPMELYENYNITLENNELHIIERETYIVAQNVEKFYDEQAVIFTAKLFGIDNVEITNASISYTYMLNNEAVEEMKNVGNYVVEVNATAGENNKTATATYNVVIKTNIIAISINNAEVIYNAQEYVPNFTYVMSKTTDISSILSYNILDENNEETIAQNAEDYVVKFNISNGNYALTKSTFAVQIKPIEISIKIQDRQVVYGENIAIENTTYKVVSGAIFEGEDLNLTYFVIDFNGNVGKYIVSANVGNNNYQVSVESAILNVVQREVIIDYGTLVYDYNSQDYFTELKPSLINVLEQDRKAFAFKLYKDNDLTTEFRNAGNYTLKLAENAILNNYSINKIEEDYIINQKDITLKPNALEKTYNQELLIEEFGVESVTLAGYDSLENIANIEYEVFEDNILLNDISKLDVGTYIITLKLIPMELYENYNITLENNELHIVERGTYIVAQNVEKFYDEQVVEFSAKMFAVDNTEISDAVITYTITLNNEVVEDMINVGNYVVKVNATAGTNNKPANATYNVVIKTNVVSIEVNNSEVIYNAEEYIPSFTYVMSEEIDISSTLSYKILDKNSEETTAQSAGDYIVEFDISNENYALTKSNFAVKIKPIDVSVQIEDRMFVFGEDFDMAETQYSVVSGNVVQGEDLMLTFAVWEFDGNVGVYDVTANSNNHNYNVRIDKAKITIVQRELHLTYLGESELIFSEQGYPNILTAQIDGALTEDVYSIYYLNSNNQQTQNIVDAGTYYLVAEVVNNNYKFENTNETTLVKTIIIVKKTMDLEILIDNKVYDSNVVNFVGVNSNGSELSSEIYVIEYYKDGVLTAQPKDAGIYTIKIVETIAKNYVFTNNERDFEISKREISINEIKSTYNYSRSTIKPQLTLNNVVDGEDVKLNVEYVETVGKFKEVGEYTINILGIVGANASNYKLVAEEKIVYNIIPSNVEVVIGNNKFMFTNKAVEEEQLNIQFISEFTILREDYEISTLPVDAGNHKIDFTSKNSGITFSITSFDVLINKAEINEIILEDKTVTYNNKPHTIVVNKTTLENGVEINVEYSNNSFVDAGIYEIFATLTNKNYNTKVLTATLVINCAEITVATSNIDDVFTYNQKEQGVEILGFDSLWYNQLISYEYVGEGYSSISKPTNAGKYSLNINADNANNIEIKNPTTDFVIKTKAIKIESLQEQTSIYSASEKEYKVQYSGVINGDDVNVEVLYGNTTALPRNTGNYVITFAGLSGLNSQNYHIENSEATSLLKIKPYPIKVKAENKSTIYGEPEVELTFVNDAVFEGDQILGNVQREEYNTIGNYRIMKGTLDAGDNYDIIFEEGIYSIKKRQLNFEDFQKEFVYNGESQIPSITFTNVIAGDGVVAKVSTVGDTINVGTYDLRFVIINPNYSLPEISSFKILINKKEASEKIVTLITPEADYSGNHFEPMVMVDEGLDYTLSFKFNGVPVAEMIDAGTYQVDVMLNNQNLKGTKTFEFTINKVEYNRNILDNIKVDVTSGSLIVSGLENITVSVDGIHFFEEKVENLEQKTEYALYVKVGESENFKVTTFLLGEFKTCPSAEVINERVEEIINKEDLTTENIEDIKEILKECGNLTELEEEGLLDENLIELKNKYEEYFNEVNNEIEHVRIASDIVDFNGSVRIRKLSISVSMLCAGILFVKKGKKKDENNN